MKEIKKKSRWLGLTHARGDGRAFDVCGGETVINNRLGKEEERNENRRRPNDLNRLGTSKQFRPDMKTEKEMNFEKKKKAGELGPAVSCYFPKKTCKGDDGWTRGPTIFNEW